MTSFNEEFRFGSARWATFAEIGHAGLLRACPASTILSCQRQLS